MNLDSVWGAMFVFEERPERVSQPPLRVVGEAGRPAQEPLLFASDRSIPSNPPSRPLPISRHRARDQVRGEEHDGDDEVGPLEGHAEPSEARPVEASWRIFERTGTMTTVGMMVSQARRWSLAIAALLSAFVVTVDARADIYVYTDADGVTHFTNVRKAGAKLYVRSQPNKNKTRPGVTPVPPSDKSLERFTRYDQAIIEAATLYQLPQELVRAVIKVESDYDPRAVSTAGAQGLMQLMPETALRMQIRDSFDPRLNILAGTRYLRILANTFNGDIQLTVAAYNAGEGAVARHGGIPPYAETQAYVTKVLHFYHRYRTLRDRTRASIDG